MMPTSRRSYYVGDLIANPAQNSLTVNQSDRVTLDELAKSIEQTVIPDNWQAGTEIYDFIYVDGQHSSLIVNGNSQVHAELANYLAHLRAELELKEVEFKRLRVDDPLSDD